MKRFHTSESKEADAFLNGSISEPEQDESSSASDVELRLARIDEYEQDALNKEDPLAACVGALNAGLLRIGLRNEQAIHKAIEDDVGNIMDRPQLQRAIGTHLGLTRQVDRFANLEARLAEAQMQAESAKYSRHKASASGRAGQ